MKCQLFWSIDRPRSCATGDHALVRMPRKLTVSYGPTEMLYIGASPGGLPASEASPSRHAEPPPASPRWVRTYGRPGSAAARFDIHPLSSQAWAGVADNSTLVEVHSCVPRSRRRPGIGNVVKKVLHFLDGSRIFCNILWVWPFYYPSRSIFHSISLVAILFQYFKFDCAVIDCYCTVPILVALPACLPPTLPAFLPP